MVDTRQKSNMVAIDDPATDRLVRLIRGATREHISVRLTDEEIKKQFLPVDESAVAKD